MTRITGIPEGLTDGPRYLPEETYDAQYGLFDVDNTIVGNNDPSLPSARFIEAVHTVGSTTVGLATARQWQKVGHIIQGAEIYGPSIISNGAQIVDGRTGEMLLERAIPLDAANDIISTLQMLGVEHWVQDNGVDVRWLGNEETQAHHRTSVRDHGTYARAHNIWLPPEGKNRAIVQNYEPHNPLVIVAHDITQEMISEIHDIGSMYSDQHVTTLLAHETAQADGCKTYDIFFLDSRANKQTAMNEVAEITGVPVANMMAVDDGPNGAEIVGYAGVGVAMGNAVEKTRNASVFVTADWQHDGAALAIERLMAASFTV